MHAKILVTQPFCALDDQVSAACCDDGAQCVAGLPTGCNGGCADVLLPMKTECADYLNLIGVAETVTTAAAMCGTVGDGH